MDYNIFVGTRNGNKSDKLSISQLIIEKDKNNKGLSCFKQGQHITGTVVSVNEQVTLNFNGQQVNTSKELLGNVQPGDVKNFEVVKANDTQIELKLLDDMTYVNKQSFQASMVKDADKEALLAKKDKSIKKSVKETEYKETSTKLEEINSRITEQDCMRLEEEGFPIESFTINGLSAALNRIKASGSAESQKITSKKMEAFDQESIAERLQQENLPVTPENINKLDQALGLSETVSGMDDKAMQYLISTGAQPTIGNIYKACYSGKTQLQETLIDEAWNGLQGQVKEVIQAAGYDVQQDNLDTAKWLLENKLPLTTETFTLKKDLDNLKENSDKDTVMNSLLEGMTRGMNPMEVPLLNQTVTSAEQIVADVSSIKPETVTEAVRTGTELTIRNLVHLQESQSTSKNDSTGSDTGTDTEADIEANTEVGQGSSYEEVKAKRQLEEIRLKMTLEAATQLEKQGIKIETQQLSKVVDALKELEDDYYKEYLKEADVEATDISLQILKDTTQSVEQLRYLPSYLLGSTLDDRKSQTIPSLLSEGKQLEAKLISAGTAYETLMTVPNREYGDSIKKAFSNMDSLLSEMEIENTVENQRAVRILGYNQMEINEESVNRMKAYDLQVTTMMNNLHPAVTVRMIKEGINPLMLPIDELNQTIDRIKEEQGISSEEKYSTYLRKLEKEDGITSEDRKAYIGIYRLLYNVEKSDGAALGAVIKAEQQVTLDHLLTAVQTGKKGRLNAVIDDEFGTLQGISREKESIAEQLSTFKEESGQQSGEQPGEDNTFAEQTEYLERILKQISEEISPEKLKTAGINSVMASAVASKPTLIEATSQDTIWESVKNTPIDKLLTQLQNAEAGGEQAGQEELYKAKVQEIRELCKNSEQSIRFLNDYHVPSTPLNIMMANNLLSNGESAIKRLLQLQNENKEEKSENSLKEINDLSDKLIDKHSMEEAYTQLETDAKAALNQSYSEEKIDSRKLAELKSIGQQMTFSKTLAQREYYQIPIETDKGVTNMNLTILRGTQTSGKVSVTIWSEQLGNVKAEFTLKDNILKGFIGSDNRGGLELLRENTAEIEAAAEENAIELKQMDFGVLKGNTDSYNYQNPSTGEDNSPTRADTERILYRVAKAIVQTVRSVVDSGSDADKAVS